MAEKPIRIPLRDFSLQALYEEGRAGTPEIGVLCHPHPLHGGSMRNPVMDSLQRTYRQQGWATLRFNFRGVGDSGGCYGDGIGEVEDVTAVVCHLAGLGKNRFHCAGYSFGAWVLMRALQTGMAPASLVLVSPPLDFLDFTGLALPSGPCLITLGDSDSFCSVPSLRRWLATSAVTSPEPDVAILPGCNHFYGGRDDDLSVRISRFLTKHYPPVVAEKNRAPDR